MVWGSVLLTGFLFGISGVKPIPIILAVQALNGLILPLVTAYLIIIVNDQKLIPKEHRHASFYNLVLLLIFAAVLLIGLTSIDKSYSAFAGLKESHFAFIVTVTALLVLVVAGHVFVLGKRKDDH